MKQVRRGPPDGGYGWVVVLSTATGLSLITGLARVAGFTYVEIIEKYGSTRAKTSVIFMTSRLVTYILTPMISKLTTKYKYSSLITIGGVAMFFSLFLSSFATALWQLVITYGVLLGISIPFIMTPSLLAITMYFKSRRALAMSLYFTVGGASGLIIPIAYEILLSKYLLGGAFFVYSALSLNIGPFAQLIHQPDWIPPPRVGPRKRYHSSMSEPNEDFEMRPTNEFNGIKTEVQKPPIFQRIIAAAKHDLTIFKDPIFLIMLVTRILVMMPLLNFVQFIPDFIVTDMNLGLTKTNIAVLLSVTSIGDIVARFLTGTIIDKLPWHMKHTFAVLSTAVGVLILSFLAIHNYVILMVAHIAYGLLLGVLVVMQFILEADLMGLEKTPLSHGITQASAGIASVVMMFAVGYIRDVTGSYRIGFYLMGFSAIASGLFWLLQLCIPPGIKPTPSIIRIRADSCIDTV